MTNQNQSECLLGDVACWLVAALFCLGLLLLAVKLYDVQIADSAAYNYASLRQSERRVQTSGSRGRILDRAGVELACNRRAISIVCDVGFYQRASWSNTVEAVEQAVMRAEALVGLSSPLTRRAIRRHVNQSLAMPLVVWSDVDFASLSRFAEQAVELPGFSIRETEERVYPHASLAAHLLGYVGRDRGEVAAGDERFNFFFPEMRGRAGIELFYDDYLRGVPGEEKLLVDARGFAVRRWTIVSAKRGLDLHLTLDARLQQVVEHQLAGCRGACVVIDPRGGEILAFASAPTYDPNTFVPTLSPDLYARIAQDPAKPLLNRASGGLYAPGSTFKPIVALAALSLGVPDDLTFPCRGVFEYGAMTLHCATHWGHGELDLRHALMKSCNPYFCNLGVDIGTNAIVRAARTFGLGARTGLDFGVDAAGVVPDADWKMRTYHERWFGGDLVQMSIGQGMLLVSPLQMACVAGGIATGRLVTPHFKVGLPSETHALPYSPAQLQVVREGMALVVSGDGESRGSGWRAGEGLPFKVCGKTGTAEVGRGSTRRKNAWFIAYAPAENPQVAIALIVENGESGGSTAAPKVCEILKAVTFHD